MQWLSINTGIRIWIWFFVCLFLLAGGFVVGVFSFIFITSISWSNAPICVSEPQMGNPTDNSSRLLCVTIIFSWDVSMQLQQCTRQGSDVPAVDSSLSRWLWSILISFLLDFFGWRICFWVKFPWVKPQVWMSEWQNSHWLQMEQDFTLRVRYYGARPQVFKEDVPEKQSLKWRVCFSHTTKKQNQFMPPENPSSWYPFILANANESSVDAVLSQKFWVCLVCHIKPLKKRFCFSTANK